MNRWKDVFVFFHAYSNFLSINTFMHVCIKSHSVFSYPTFPLLLFFFANCHSRLYLFRRGFPFRFSIKSQGTTKLGLKDLPALLFHFHTISSLQRILVHTFVDGVWYVSAPMVTLLPPHKEASKKVSRQTLLSKPFIEPTACFLST